MKDILRTDRPVVLLVTTSRSLHAAAIMAELERVQSACYRVDTDRLSYPNWPEFSFPSLGNELLVPVGESVTIPAETVKAVWWDEVIAGQISPNSVEYPEWARLETEKALIWLMSSLDAYYLNNPNLILAASNKVVQLRVARSLGLNVPETLVTGSHESASAFYREKTIYKPMSRPLPSNVGTDAAILTNVISAHQVTRDAVTCKLSLFQHYIEKEYEIRVTLIGDRCFAVAIHNQGSVKAQVDWRRYDLANTPHEEIELPNPIKDACLRLNKHFGLDYSAIDLIYSKSHEYYFLELNPQGLWLWLEKLTGCPISSAVANHLLRQLGTT